MTRQIGKELLAVSYWAVSVDETLNSEWLVLTNLVRVGVDQTMGLVKNIYQGCREVSKSKSRGCICAPLSVALHPTLMGVSSSLE